MRAYRRDLTPIDEDDLHAQGAELAKERHVGSDVLEAFGTQVTVSTVFLVIDHNFSGEGPPVLWETMVFGGLHPEQYQARYRSEAAAAAGHQDVVDRIKLDGYVDVAFAFESSLDDRG